jgi:hypothetical protein
VNYNNLEIVVPPGEPIDTTELAFLFSKAGLHADIRIEGPRFVNIDAGTAVVSLFLMTTWQAFIESLAKTSGESIQNKLLELLRRIGTIIKGRKSPQWIGAKSGNVTEGSWGPLELVDTQANIRLTLPYDISWPALHKLMGLMKYATTHEWCANSSVVYSSEADVWILKRPPNLQDDDWRTVFVWDSTASQFAPPP